MIVSLLSIPYMAWTSRMCGGGWPKLPWGLDQWAHCLPYIALLWPVCGWWSIPAYLGAVLGKRTGHGAWMDMATSPKTWAREKLDVMIEWARPHLTPYGYDLLGISLSGLAITIAPALACVAFGQGDAGIALIVSGLMKGLAYSKAFEWPDYREMPDDVNEPTELGELLTGLFAGIGVFVAWLLI